jgi:ketosteroid isomerase-like protein
LRDLENRWAAATAAHDVATIQGLLAGDYVGVTASGNIVNKAGLLAELRRDKNTYDSVANARLDVRIHGSSAVIVGTTKQRGKDAAGKPFSYTYRWTDTWVERNGTWQCVASQSIRLPG